MKVVLAVMVVVVVVLVVAVVVVLVLVLVMLAVAVVVVTVVVVAALGVVDPRWTGKSCMRFAGLGLLGPRIGVPASALSALLCTRCLRTRVYVYACGCTRTYVHVYITARVTDGAINRESSLWIGLAGDDDPSWTMKALSCKGERFHGPR